MKILTKIDNGFTIVKIVCENDVSVAYLGCITDVKRRWVISKLIYSWSKIKPCRSINNKAIYLRSIAIKLIK